MASPDLHLAPMHLPFGDGWYRDIMPLHRRLADRTVGLVARRPGSTSGDPTLFAALYVAVALFGWDDVGPGLERLIGADHPALSPGFHTIVLDWLGPLGHLEALAWWVRHRGAGMTHRGDWTLAGAQTDEVISPVAAAHGLTSDLDPHHLSGHIELISRPLLTGEAVDYAGARRAVGDVTVARAPGARHAVIVVDVFDDWPSALHDFGATLSDRRPVWTAEVVSRRDGWLGRFRRCWDCGRWFMGYAATHVIGHRRSVGGG